jgi:hypothetical protein
VCLAVYGSDCQTQRAWPPRNFHSSEAGHPGPTAAHHKCVPWNLKGKTQYVLWLYSIQRSTVLALLGVRLDHLLQFGLVCTHRLAHHLASLPHLERRHGANVARRGHLLWVTSTAAGSARLELWQRRWPLLCSRRPTGVECRREATQAQERRRPVGLASVSCRRWWHSTRSEERRSVIEGSCDGIRNTAGRVEADKGGGGRGREVMGGGARPGPPRRT